MGRHLERKEIILRSNSPRGFCPFHHPDSPKGQVVRVSGELLPCMTRGSSHRPLRLLTGSPPMLHEPSRVVSRRGICLHAVQHGGVSCIGWAGIWSPWPLEAALASGDVGSSEKGAPPTSWHASSRERRRCTGALCRPVAVHVGRRWHGCLYNGRAGLQQTGFTGKCRSRRRGLAGAPRAHGMHATSGLQACHPRPEIPDFRAFLEHLQKWARATQCQYLISSASRAAVLSMVRTQAQG